MSFKITLKSEKEKIVIFSEGEEVAQDHINRAFKSIVSDAEFKVLSATYIKSAIDVNSQGTDTYSMTFLVEDTESERMIATTEIFKSNLPPEKVITEKMPELADFKKIELLSGEIFFQ